jgi:hypothetical protein
MLGREIVDVDGEVNTVCGRKSTECSVKPGGTCFNHRRHRPNHLRYSGAPALTVKELDA